MTLLVIHYLEQKCRSISVAGTRDRSFCGTTKEHLLGSSFADSFFSTNNTSYLTSQSFLGNGKELATILEKDSGVQQCAKGGTWGTINTRYPVSCKNGTKNFIKTNKASVNKSFTQSKHVPRAAPKNRAGGKKKENVAINGARKPPASKKCTKDGCGFQQKKGDMRARKENISMYINADTSMAAGMDKINSSLIADFAGKTFISQDIREKLRISRAKLLESDLKYRYAYYTYRLQLAQRDQVKTKFMLYSIVNSLDASKKGTPDLNVSTQNNELLGTLCSMLSSRLHKS